MLSVGLRIPEKNILLSTGTPKQKVAMLDAAKMLASKGYNLFATGGTHRFLEENGISSTRVYWPSEEDMEPQALTMLHERKIDMVVNIPRDLSAGELNNGYKIRRARHRSERSAHHKCPSGKRLYRSILHAGHGRYTNPKLAGV